MKILVTGSEGFVGKTLVAGLKAKGMEVFTVDMIPGFGTQHHVADIRSKDILNIIPEQADAIIHLAGLTRNQDCQDKAYACFDANVMATLNLIEAAQAKKVKQFIFASSEWIYGEWKDSSIVKDEDSLLDTHALVSEYALSKLVSEANLKQKFQHGFCATTILRFGIIYGPRDKSGSAVESLFHAVRTEPEVKVGSLKTGRCFIHVEDIVSGIISAIGLSGLNIINLQGDKLITLKDVIEESKKILGKDPKIIETSPENYNIRNATNTRAAKLLGWKPRYGLQEGLMSLTASKGTAPLKNMKFYKDPSLPLDEKEWPAASR